MTKTALNPRQYHLGWLATCLTCFDIIKARMDTLLQIVSRKADMYYSQFYKEAERDYLCVKQ